MIYITTKLKYLVFALLLVLSFAASAAGLTPLQASTLKTAALADQTAAVYIQDGDDQALADWLNTIQPSFWVFISVLSTDAARVAISKGISQLDNLTVGKRDSLLWFFSVSTTPPDPSVAQAINDLCGTQNTLKNALLDALRRTATRAEKLLSTGTGTNASPATMSFEGLFDKALASSVRGS